MRPRPAWLVTCSLLTGCGGAVVETAADHEPGYDAGTNRRAATPEAGTTARAALPEASSGGSAGEGDPSAKDAGPVCAASYRCAGPTFVVDATGTLEGSPIAVNRAAVEYEHGFTNSTLLSFQAVWDGEPATLLVTLRGEVPEAQVPPGVYESSDLRGTSDGAAAFVSVAGCHGVSEPRGVTVEVVEHSGQAFEGTPIRLLGEFRLKDAPASSLSIAFDIDAVCALHTST